MKNVYNLPKDIKEFDYNLLYEEVDEPAWHVNNFNTKNSPCKQIRCKICGSDKFHVAIGYYMAGIKCPNCGYEIPIYSE